MAVILSFATLRAALYAAGPDGLFLVEGSDLTPQPQPMSSLTCCGAVGESLLVGGAPHGAASRSPLGEWQASWMDYTSAPVLTFAPAPGSEESGVLLAATGGDGILRSTNRGRTWTLCNFGLHEFTVLALAWAPPAAANAWPRREIAFAGSDRALYRSPASGLGWQRLPLPAEDAFQAIALSPLFHTDGMVMAGGEESGLWRSTDGGRSFTHARSGPKRVDALLAGDWGWLAATPQGIWHSGDALVWQLLSDSPPALALCTFAGRLWAGGEFGAHPVCTLASLQGLSSR